MGSSRRPSVQTSTRRYQHDGVGVEEGLLDGVVPREDAAAALGDEGGIAGEGDERRGGLAAVPEEVLVEAVRPVASAEEALDGGPRGLGGRRGVSQRIEDLSGLGDGALPLGARQALGDVDQEDEGLLLLEVSSDLGEGEREEAEQEHGRSQDPRHGAASPRGERSAPGHGEHEEGHKYPARGPALIVRFFKEHSKE